MPGGNNGPNLLGRANKRRGAVREPYHASALRKQVERDSARGGVTKIDAHVHSKASDGAAISALGLIRCPECYSEPEAVYDQAMARGMDLVTITDHDTIKGAMELVERGFDRFIVGQEVSVLFPEDRCMLHVLVWDLTPELDDELNKLKLREDVYEFARWLRARDLPHACAHPLYIQNGRLKRWHVERATLLFRAFECLNGAHAKQVSDAAVRYVDGLTSEATDALAAEHGITPLYDEPWKKAQTGGSDDHGLLNIGRTWTQIVSPDGRKIRDPKEFFRRTMAGESTQEGVGGHPALLAHQLATVGAHFYADRMYRDRSPAGRYLSSKLLKFAGVDVKAPSKKKVAAYKTAQKLAVGKKRKTRSLPIVRALKKQMRPVLEKYPDLAARLDPESWTGGAPISEHERMAEFIQDLTAALGQSMKPGALKALKKRDPTGLVEHLMSYGVLHLAQLPYLISLIYQNKERNFLDRFEHETSRSGAGISVLERPMRVSLFTDTIADVNGVCRFIQNVAEQAHTSGRDLQVITSSRKAPPPAANIHNFDPVFAADLPKYESLDLCLPPVMKILRHVDEHQPDVIHISTPGPVGLVGFLAAKIHKIPVLGVYHTDFPAYVDQLFDDHTMTSITRWFMRAFYKPFSSVFTRSEDYVRSLVGLGLEPEKMVSLMPGFDTTQFHPRFERREIWTGLGVNKDAVKVLYVGRVSVEKNMPFLEQAWLRAHKQIIEAGGTAELVIVGDGPYRPQMEKALKGKNASFLGFRHGQELSEIYASSDLFAFPSTTDTLGQVVMESQGSGLPVLVSDQGGPKEVVEEGRTGHVLAVDEPAVWAEAIADLAINEERRKAMGRAATSSMQRFSLDNSFDHFWQVHTGAWHNHLAKQGITMESRGRAVLVEDKPAEAELLNGAAEDLDSAGAAPSPEPARA